MNSGVAMGRRCISHVVDGEIFSDALLSDSDRSSAVCPGPLFCFSFKICSCPKTNVHVYICRHRNSGAFMYLRSRHRL